MDLEEEVMFEESNEEDKNEVPKTDLSPEEKFIGENETDYVAMSSRQSSEESSEDISDVRLDYLIELEQTWINSLIPLEKWAEQYYPFWIECD